MEFKSSDNQKGFLAYFRIIFFIVLLQALWILLKFSPKAYHRLASESIIQFWVYIAILLAMYVGGLILFFNPDFKLINGTVTQFTIDSDCITVTTSPFRILPFINKPSYELKLMIREFSRDKTNYPARIFPNLKFPTWELRTDETSVYIISRFFTAAAIEELEKFLYWKSI